MDDTTMATWTTTHPTNDAQTITMSWIRTVDGRDLYLAEADGYVVVEQSVMQAQDNLAAWMAR